MTRSNLFLHGCSYALGEVEHPVTAIDGFTEFLVGQQMIDDADLWGWGSYRATRRTVVELWLDAAGQSLSAFARESVDAVILCGARFPTDVDGHAELVGRFLEAVGLPHAIPYGVTLNRCATLVAGLGLAEALVGSGHHRAALVVAGDAVSSPDERLRPFAVFSDGAASCIVASGLPGPFELLATAGACDAAAMTVGGQISADLTRRVNAALAARTGIDAAAVRRLAHNNVFKPIVVMKEQMGGFRRDQLFLENIARAGHVFACDPLVNLADLAGSGAVGPGDAVAMGSSVSGARFGALLRMR
ncbi:hypothetical protein [Arenibaculum sp.]|uniref:hypothetical protein n=1 Tax=Arenibaculum sp. TaxID=2865862 RepID=UPI002E1033BE|nr:hypothetical protein [Arenibaculum sp.]